MHIDLTSDRRSRRFRARDQSLGRFNWHPDPVIDFLIEVEGLENRVWDRERGICKPGKTPERLDDIEQDLANALWSNWLDLHARDARRSLYALAERVKQMRAGNAR